MHFKGASAPFFYALFVIDLKVCLASYLERISCFPFYYVCTPNLKPIL